MSNTTKLALEASLKKLLLKKPVDKITINDLTEDCGISRMAFYYHFKDIYDLIEWACLEDGKRALADKKTYSCLLYTSRYMASGNGVRDPVGGRRAHRRRLQSRREYRKDIRSTVKRRKRL